MSQGRQFAGFGAAFALLAVAGGAFGSHALEARLTSDLLGVFETAVRYQMYHAVGLLVLGAFLGRSSRSPLLWAGWLFIAGTIIFSGSLYLLALTGFRWLGAVTPVGGICLLAGWAAFLWGIVMQADFLGAVESG